MDMSLGAAYRSAKCHCYRFYFCVWARMHTLGLWFFFHGNKCEDWTAFDFFSENYLWWFYLQVISDSLLSAATLDKIVLFEILISHKQEPQASLQASLLNGHGKSIFTNATPPPTQTNTHLTLFFHGFVESKLCLIR